MGLEVRNSVSFGRVNPPELSKAAKEALEASMKIMDDFNFSQLPKAEQIETLKTRVLMSGIVENALKKLGFFVPKS